MVISARWLFENHKKHLAMAKYYQELLDHPDNISAQASQNASDYGKALKEYLSYLLYFDLVQIILTDEEKWLVEHIFIKEETYYYLISNPDSPVQGCSKATISRHKKRLLEKADSFLRETCLKNG